MDKHIDALKKLCRVCGGKILWRDGYSNAKSITQFADLLANNGIGNINCDDAHIHPQLVCNKCNMKLYHLKKNPAKPVQWTLFCFTAHTPDNSCHVCTVAGVYKRTEQNFDSSVLLSAGKYGFKDFEHNSIFGGYHNRLGFIGTHIQEVRQNVFGCHSHEVIKTLEIFEKGEYFVKIHGKRIPKETLINLNFPNIGTLKNIDDIFQLLHQSNICQGNDDFPDLVSRKFGNLDEFKFLSTDKSVASHLETSDGKTLSDIRTIRHESCDLLVHPSKGKRCDICLKYRPTLFAMRSRKRKSDENGNEDVILPTINNRYLKSENLIKKLEQVQAEKANIIRKYNSMKKYVRSEVFSEGVNLDNSTRNVCNAVLKQSENPFKEDSPQNLPWNEQKKYASIDPRGMRWHPLIIRWSLSIYLKSPGTYNHIQSGPFMYLPCKSTLLKYINFTTPGCGFNPDIIQRLLKKVRETCKKDPQCNVGLAFDEMKIKSGLVFDKLTGKLVGFTEMGEINDDLERFERFCSDDQGKEKSVAKYVMVFMARGLCSGLEYVFGHFASEGFTSDQIFYCAHEATGILESLGLKVRSITADGATPNRKFFELHKLKDSTNLFHGHVYWMYNPWAYSSKRKIYFFSDPPHLMKTTRNNLENSYANKKSRTLVFDGKDMGWHQIMNVYDWDLGPSRYCLGIRFGHKLKQEHVKLDPRSRMRVNLAAQVLSCTVADMLDEQRDAGEASGTESLSKFIRLMDKFFDCLNVSRLINKTRKKAKDKYINSSDWRFEWLETEFLKFFDDWDAQVNSQENLKADEKARFKLSHQTLVGLRITTMSFIKLGKLLFDDENAEFFLSEKISQDPVEEYFSKQRARGNADEHPDLQMVNRNVLALDVTGDELLKVLNGNVRHNNRKRPTLDVTDMTRLPTKKSKP